MGFPFVLRKLKKVLDKEQTLAAIGADRFAPGRVVEVKQAMEVLKNHAEQVKTEKHIEKVVIKRKTIRLSEFINQITLFK